MQMGLGLIGRPDIIFKRKFRWTLEIGVPGCGLLIPPHFCKTASRPKISLDSTDVHFLNAVTYLPNKGKWDPLAVTYYDIVSDGTLAIMSWLNTLYGFQNFIDLPMSEKGGYDGYANLILVDGCGKPLELWQLLNVYPESVDFGDLDYESNEVCTINMSLKFTHVQYTNLCGNNQIQSCCVGCED